VILHPEELDLARAYANHGTFEGLTAAQLQKIRERARVLHRWFRTHPLTHSAISIAVLIFLFTADYWILLKLPRVFLGAAVAPSVSALVIAALVVGALHSYLLYSLAFFTMHDGYSHKVLFPMTTRLGRAAHLVGSNLCRVASAEPQYFAKYHLPHHLKFGTEEDGEFLNFVMPRRYWLSLLPFAAITNFNDFLIHRPPDYTKSRLVSVSMALSYNGVYAYFMYQAFGGLFAFIVIALLPHVGFYLDRLRQFTEHNLMPLEQENGARSLGLGFWGMLLGGGPWGSPCHLEHHLAVGLPWYGQLLLHRHLRSLLTPRQRKQFLVQPVIGWPKLLWQIMRSSYAFRRKATVGTMAGSTD
jgi:fatty acid desaturase